MATFGQIVYSVLDLLKERANDAYFTEEHVMFLAVRFRALLLNRKYRNSRNASYDAMSEENMQEICVDLEPTELLPDGCDGMWLWSKEKIPDMMNISSPKVNPISELMHSKVQFIPAERMPYVGYNKWLRNIVYASKGMNDHLYLHGQYPQFMYLKRVKVSGVFSDPEQAAKMSCDAIENGGCDILSAHFPLEEALVPSCIEMVVQELIGARFAPEDKQNDAKDGHGDAAVTNAKQNQPAETLVKQTE